MTQQEIAEATGHTQPSIHYVLKGDRTPSMKFSIELEEATGICREAWMFPERHRNPYIPFYNVFSCLTCKNRVNRTLKAIEMMSSHFELALNDTNYVDKTKVFKDITKIISIYTGIDGSVFVWRELTDKGLKLLGSSSVSEKINRHPLFEMLSFKSFKLLRNWVESENSLVVPHFPYGMPKEWADEMNIFFESELKSIIAIPRGGLMFSMYSDRFPIMWTEAGIEALEAHVEHISELWKEYNNQIDPK